MSGLWVWRCYLLFMVEWQRLTVIMFSRAVGMNNCGATGIAFSQIGINAPQKGWVTMPREALKGYVSSIALKITSIVHCELPGLWQIPSVVVSRRQFEYFTHENYRQGLVTITPLALWHSQKVSGLFQWGRNPQGGTDVISPQGVMWLDVKGINCETQIVGIRRFFGIKLEMGLTCAQEASQDVPREVLDSVLRESCSAVPILSM